MVGFEPTLYRLRTEDVDQATLHPVWLLHPHCLRIYRRATAEEHRNLVRLTGLEPACPKAVRSERTLATNYSTDAKLGAGDEDRTRLRRLGRPTVSIEPPA